jgi:hypothetical protein
VQNARAEEMPGISAFELAVPLVHHQWPGLQPVGLAAFQQAIIKEVCDSYSIPQQDRAKFGECVYGRFKQEFAHSGIFAGIKGNFKIKCEEIEWGCLLKTGMMKSSGIECEFATREEAQALADQGLKSLSPRTVRYTVVETENTTDLSEHCPMCFIPWNHCVHGRNAMR